MRLSLFKRLLQVVIFFEWVYTVNINMFQRQGERERENLPAQEEERSSTFLTPGRCNQLHSSTEDEAHVWEKSSLGGSEFQSQGSDGDSYSHGGAR